jgi:hypothetical protein
MHAIVPILWIDPHLRLAARIAQTFDSVGTDKEGMEITLIDIVGSNMDEAVDDAQLNWRSGQNYGWPINIQANNLQHLRFGSVPL